MKKTELSRKWWNEIKPKEVKGVELEKALTAVEQSEGEQYAAALAAVPAAIAKVAKGLDKKVHKDLLKSLDGLLGLAETELKKATEAQKAQAQAAAKAQADEESPEGEEEEETKEDQIFDPEVVGRTIRRALRGPIVFAFAINAKPEDCVLGLKARGSPVQLLRLAKTRSGSAKGCCGQARADENDPKMLVLSVEGQPTSGVVRALRKYFQFTGIRLFRKIKLMVDGQVAEVESDAEETAPAAAPTAPAGAVPPSARTPPVQMEESAVPPTPEEIEVLDDRRRLFKKARAAWVGVKAKAEMDLEKVKDGARTMYLADAKQFPRIAEGCKAIDDVLDNLDDELRDTLDQYASTPLRNQNRLRALAETAEEVLDRYLSFVESNSVLKAIDLKEFADVTIHAPILKALKDLRRALE